MAGVQFRRDLGGYPLQPHLGLTAQPCAGGMDSLMCRRSKPRDTTWGGQTGASGQAPHCPARLTQSIKLPFLQAGGCQRLQRPDLVKRVPLLGWIWVSKFGKPPPWTGLVAIRLPPLPFQHSSRVPHHRLRTGLWQLDSGLLQKLAGRRMFSGWPTWFMH